MSDEPDELVLWCPKGTIRKVPATAPTRAEAPTRGERHANSLEALDWVYEDSVWDVSTLWLLRDSDWHAVWVSFLDTGEQWGWYVNFQEPLRRTAHAIQTMDLALDIIVEPDRSAWRWKDKDEFELFEARELISRDVADRVRAEARSVIQRIEQDEAPFNESWPRWRPDPSWPIPVLPEEWDVL